MISSLPKRANTIGFAFILLFGFSTQLGNALFYNIYILKLHNQTKIQLFCFLFLKAKVYSLLKAFFRNIFV